MATLIFYKRISYSRGWSCVSQHFRHINKAFFNARRLAAWRAIFYPSISGGGLPHRLLPPPRGLGLSLGALKRGMPTGPRAFLETTGCVWATALHPDPPKKGLVPYLPVRWGRQQIPIAPGKAIFILSFGLRGPSPLAFTSFGRVGFIARRLRRPQKGECRRGRGHFWKLPDACGLRPCTRIHHKKALCHTCPLGGAGNKYRSLPAKLI